MNLYKKCTSKSYCFLEVDTTLASDNHSRFRKNLLEITEKLIMAIDDNIREEKLQDDVNRAAAKKSALLPGKIDQFKYLAGEEIVQHDEGRVINKLSLHIFH